MDRSGIDRQHYPIQLRQAIAEYLPTRGLPLAGQRRWSDRLLVIVMILVVWSSQPTLLQRFAEARSACIRMYFSRLRPGKTFVGFMGVMKRRSARLLVLVTGTFRARMRQEPGANWRVGRFLAFGVDGTKIDCPRTQDNQKRFKNGGRKKSGPQMLLVSLIHLGTGLIWSWRKSDAAGSERGLLGQMLGELPPGALLVADAGFVGYEAMRRILASGHSLLMRAGANTLLLKKLGYAVQEEGGIVYLWPQAAQRKEAHPLVLRQILFKDGRNRRICLLTSVLKAEEFPEEEAMALYRRRWQVELLFRAMKQTLCRRKMLSDSPAHAEVELDWTVVGAWLLGLMLWEKRRTKTPAIQGIAQALRIVREAMSGQGDRRRSLDRRLAGISSDRYVRHLPKKAREWPHKKNDPPCREPEMRTATKRQVRLAQALRDLKLAA
jgi:hypothetical protein